MTRANKLPPPPVSTFKWGLQHPANPTYSIRNSRARACTVTVSLCNQRICHYSLIFCRLRVHSDAQECLTKNSSSPKSLQLYQYTPLAPQSFCVFSFKTQHDPKLVDLTHRTIQRHSATVHFAFISIYILNFLSFPVVQQPKSGLDRVLLEVFRPHSDTHHSR
jgi:hypothetical protein